MHSMCRVISVTSPHLVTPEVTFGVFYSRVAPRSTSSASKREQLPAADVAHALVRAVSRLFSTPARARESSRRCYEEARHGNAGGLCRRCFSFPCVPTPASARVPTRHARVRAPRSAARTEVFLERFHECGAPIALGLHAAGEEAEHGRLFVELEAADQPAVVVEPLQTVGGVLEVRHRVDRSE